MGLCSKCRSRQFGFLVTWVALAVVAPGMAQAAPVNDGFNGGTKLFGADVAIAGSTVGAGKQAGEPNHAGNSGGHSTWYRWVPPSDSTYRVDTCESGFDTLLAIYTGGTVDALTPVVANDDGAECGPQSQVVFQATTGTTYRIAVDGKNGATGNLRLVLHRTPANDDFAQARALFYSEDSDTANNFLATKQAGEPNYAGNGGGHSIWYRWDAVTSGPTWTTTCGSDFDTILAVYTGTSVNALTPVAANDDGAECGPQSEVNFSATAGHRYWVAVDGKDGAVGNVELSMHGWPTNDDFADATIFHGPAEFESTNNVLLSKEVGEQEHAGNAGGHSLWYRLEPLVGNLGELSVDTCGSDFDTLLAVYRYVYVGGADPLINQVEPLGSNDDGCGSRSALSFAAPQYVMVGPNLHPAVYYIAVDGKNGARGHVEIRLRPHPANDDFAEASPIEVGATAAGYNTGALHDGGEPSHAGNPERSSVWYRWTAPFSGPVALDTCDSDFDTLLAVYTGTGVNALTPVAANDDGAGCGPQSELTFAATAGTTYRIAVDGRDGAAGDILLRLAKVLPPSPPANDDFSSPEGLSGREARSDHSTNTAYATKQAGEPEHAGNPGGDSLWYSWTAPADGTVKLDTCESGFDTLLAVYTGTSVNALTPVAANDDGAVCGPASEPRGTRSQLTMTVSASTTYRIAVDGYDDARGNVDLYLRFAASPTPNPRPVPIEEAAIVPVTPPPPCRRGTVRKHGKCVSRPHKCPKGKVRKRKRCVNRHRHSRGHGR